jgi:branched-subunit amino acid ABC-type transport system permease component
VSRPIVISVRRPLLLLVALAMGISLVAGMAQAVHAQEPEPEQSVRGTLIDRKATRDRVDDVPVKGAVVSVTRPDGRKVGTGTSDADGVFVVGVPEPGNYVVVLERDSLPEGVDVKDEDRTVEVRIDPGQSRTVILDLGSRTRDTTTQFERFLQLTFAGARFGLIIGIAAVGLSLIFGVTGLTNFMHGEMVTFGAIMAWLINTHLGLHIVPATILAMGVSAVAAALLDTGLWRQLRRRRMSLLSMMVVSIGLSLALRNLFQFLFGESPRPFRQYSSQRGYQVGGVTMAPKDLWSIAIALLAMLGVAYILQRTRMGKAMRAVSDNPDLAASSGIDVEGVIRSVWALGGALACLGGVLFALNERVAFNSGFNLLLLMFAGITLGGLGTAYGALVGSFIVGMFVNVSTLWVPSEMKTVGALGVLIIVLLIRPQGIMGQAERVG